MIFLFRSGGGVAVYFDDRGRGIFCVFRSNCIACGIFLALWRGSWVHWEV